MPDRNLFTLLVGINDYQHNLQPLVGCENDVTQMATYLETVACQQLIVTPPQILINEEATKSQIVDSFRETLVKPAQKGDVVLFYFSGHGGQEIAPQPFEKYEEDHLLEGLVCYDGGNGGVPLLADKELRYLFQPLKEKECDVVLLFDCCHSGDNTRSLLDVDMDWNKKSVPEDAAPRDWEDFIFAQEDFFQDPTLLQDQDWDELMPQVRHIQMSACRDCEIAYENRIRNQGFFTNSLLTVLNKTQGNVTYLELQYLIRNHLGERNIPQSPQLYTPEEYQQDKNKLFLIGEFGQLDQQKRQKEFSI